MFGSMRVRSKAFGKLPKIFRESVGCRPKTLLKLHKDDDFAFFFARSYVIMVMIKYQSRQKCPVLQKGVCVSQQTAQSVNMADYRSTGKELRRSPKGPIAALLGVIIFAGAGYGALKIVEKFQPIEVAQDSSEVDLSVPDVTDTTEERPHTIFVFENHFASEVHQGPLILVNRSTSLPEDYEDGLVSVFAEKNEYLHVKDTSVSLQQEAMDALNELATGFYDATGNSSLLVLSGYRTREYQKQLYDADLLATGKDTSDLVAQPGCSEHESGYAFDLSLYLDGELADYDGTGVYNWVNQHCAEYGIILRYPKDKVNITEFSHEPWHYRYVGVPHALYMQAHNLCLEEYMDLLDSYPYEGEHLEIPDADGNICEVFTISLEDSINDAVAEIPVAAELPYTVSGNNRGKFVVTVMTGRPMEEDTETTAAPEDGTEDSTEDSPADTTEAE